MDSEDFNQGIDVGVGLGRYEAEAEAQRAYDAGEIELWLDFHKPKTGEEWDAWEAEHGSLEEFSKRWSSK